MNGRTEEAALFGDTLRRIEADQKKNDALELPRLGGRYVLYEQIASGGMASVHLGVVLGDAGFRRTVAIKRLHPHVAASPGALDMFIDEARLSARVTHRNIVNTLDVVRHEDRDELFLVMEYVHGVPLAAIEHAAKARGERIDPAFASAVMLDVLAGLSAIHNAKDEQGRSLEIVHRDVSPQNILVSVDGSARVLDFGIAKAAVRIHTTRDDRLKGKLHYMAPEQFLDEEVDGRTDQFAAGVVLWGLLTGKRLFEASNEAAIVARVLEGTIPAPSQIVPSISAALDEVVLRALSRAKGDRFESCDAFAAALRRAEPPAASDDVRQAVVDRCGADLDARSALLTRIESGGEEQQGSSVPAANAAVETATLTVTVPDVATSGRRRRSIPHVAALGVGLVVVVVAIATLVWIRTTHRTNEPPVLATPAPSESTFVVVAAPPSASVAMAPASSSVSRPAAAAKPRPVPAAKKTSSCAQMYYRDANGIQRVKEECL